MRLVHMLGEPKRGGALISIYQSIRFAGWSPKSSRPIWNINALQLVWRSGTVRKIPTLWTKGEGGVH